MFPDVFKEPSSYLVLTQHSLALKLIVLWLGVAWAVQEKGELLRRHFLLSSLKEE